MTAAMNRLPNAIVPNGAGMSQQEEEGRRPDEQPLRTGCPRGSSDDRQVAHGEHPPTRAEDGEPEHPWLQRRPVMDDLEQCLLLRRRKVACALHRESGADAGQRVVGAEVDEKDAHTEPGLPGTRAVELVGQDEHRDGHQAYQTQLDHVEAHEPGGGVQEGLDVVVRLRMEDGETGEHEWGREEEHAPRSGRRPPDRALDCARAGLQFAHCLFLSRRSVSQERVVEEADDASLVLEGCGIDATGVVGPGDLPHPLRCARGRVVDRLPGVLAADSGVGVDEEDRTWRDGADVVDDRWRRLVVGEDGRRGRHHGLGGVDQEPGES